MPTSSDSTLSLTRDQLATAILRKLGVLAKGQTPDSDDLSNAGEALNARIAQFRKLGMPVWKRTEYSFAPIANKSTYTFGESQEYNTPFPLNLLQAYKVISPGTTKITLEPKSDYDYNRLPTQTSTGSPIQYTYQPKNNIGVLKLWPVPTATDAGNTTITIVYTAPMYYFTGGTQTLDLPEEWYLPLIYNTAVDLAPEWGIALPERSKLSQEAKMFLDTVLESAGEDGSHFFAPERY